MTPTEKGYRKTKQNDVRKYLEQNLRQRKHLRNDTSNKVLANGKLFSRVKRIMI